MPFFPKALKLFPIKQGCQRYCTDRDLVSKPQWCLWAQWCMWGWSLTSPTCTCHMQHMHETGFICCIQCPHKLQPHLLLAACGTSLWAQCSLWAQYRLASCPSSSLLGKIKLIPLP